MENYDDDFSTLKHRPSTLNVKPVKSLSQWDSDIPMHDGDATVKLKPKQSLAHLQREQFTNDFDDGFGDDFDEEDFETDLKLAARKHADQKKTSQPSSNHHRASSDISLPESFLSDSSSKSPGRASVSSLASSVSVATSWDQDDDFGFEFDDKNASLEARFKNRAERAEREAQKEASNLAANYQKTVSKKSSRPFINMDEEDDVDELIENMDQLTLRVKNGTVNRNIKLNQQANTNKHQLRHQQSQASLYPSQLMQPQQQPASRLLKGMRSIAQLPNKRSDLAANPSQSRIRTAVSMYDLGSRRKHSAIESGLIPESGANTTINTPAYQTQQPQLQKLRPLTAYKEPVKKPHKSDTRKPKTLNTIRNPVPNLQRQERGGMIFNPHTMMWEGNDFDASRFDSIDDNKHHAKPTLITKERFIEEGNEELDVPAENTGMHFDNRTLSWVYANEEEYDDPFADIDDFDSAPIHTPQQPSNSSIKQLGTPFSTPKISSGKGFTFNQKPRKFTNDSQVSTETTISRNSVSRSETSSHEVFDISARMISEWKHADERFMRKFGKWIGGDEEIADSRNADQHIYEMVRHA